MDRECSRVRNQKNRALAQTRARSKTSPAFVLLPSKAAQGGTTCVAKGQDGGRFRLTFAVGDAAAGEIVRRELHGDLVTWQDADEELAHFA